MFRHLFRNRLFLAGLICLLSIVIGGTLYLRHVQQETDREFAHTEEAAKPTTDIQPDQVSDTPDPQPPQAQDTTDTPAEDPVAAAWQRLDYISKNIYEWGGIPSPKAPPLMQEIEDILPADDEGSGEVLIELLDELARLRDPRSVEIIVRCMFGGGEVWGRLLEEALIAIGPPSVPHLIPYLNTESDIVDAIVIARILAGVAEQYASESGGAVEHIILPELKNLEATVSDRESKYSTSYRIKQVQTALGKIQK